MDGFRETAFYLTAWHAFLVTLISVLFIVLQDFEPAAALLIAANITLLFSLVLMARAGGLTDRRVTRGSFWRTLPLASRPPGEAGLRMARQALQETWLRFAKAAAAAAIILTGLACASNSADKTAWAKAARTSGLTQMDANKVVWSGYRPGVVRPMN
jgi:hypothetical protein